MTDSARTSARPSAVIMAAGKGTRMQGAGVDLPKVMHEVADRPMLHWVIDAAAEAGASPIVIVVGHRADLVRRSVEGMKGRDGSTLDIEFVMQEPQLGTGHAVDQARPLFEKGRLGRETFVLAGDGPLIRAATLVTLLERHRSGGAAATLATSVIPDPSGYGRVLRSADGGLDRIVEERDASSEIRAVREVNPSYYCFDTQRLFDALRHVENTNAAREYYLTDVFAVFRRDGGRVAVLDAVPPEDVLSINTPEQQREVDTMLRARLAAAGGAHP